MAFDAANNSPRCRSSFQKSVCLHDWWLTKPETDDNKKALGVAGLTCTSQQNWTERCFFSAPILKTYDFFELETVDGVCVILQGYINKDRTLESGFSPEVFDHFVIGFPLYWEEFSTSCPKRGAAKCVTFSSILYSLRFIDSIGCHNEQGLTRFWSPGLCSAVGQSSTGFFYLAAEIQHLSDICVAE